MSTNLAAALGKATYVDCDVEEPNGRLFLRPEHVEKTVVSQIIPSFDAQKCNGCRECVKFCRFNALIYIKKAPMLFTEVCHSCGGCRIVCPQKAITETSRPIGTVEKGKSGETTVITGVLNPGEASGNGVIQEAIREADGAETVIIDCPPGSACSVQESIAEADFCILVAEPTAFGFHNFQMVQELVSLHHKPCGIVINKQEEPYEPLEVFCREHQLPILLRLPYERKLGSLLSQGKLAGREDPELRQQLLGLYYQIGGAVQ